MKRLKGIFVSTILIVCLILNTFEVRADDDTTYETASGYSTIAHYHFEQLKTNVPENVIGSCVYVSMSLILSFYDSYWHDIFVAENFEYNGEWDENEYNDGRPVYYVYSNNLLEVPLLNLENDEWTSFEADGGTYSDFVNNSSNQAKYLHLYLISLGIARGYHSGDSSDTDYGINITEQVTILDDYFDLIFGEANYAGVNGVYDDNLPLEIHYITEYTEGVTREDVISKINEQLGVGNPVIYNGKEITENGNNNDITSDNDDLKKTKSGHSMVAYAIETENNISDILLHQGYTDDPYTQVNQTDYSHNIEACWIEINEDVLPHACPTENEEESFYDYVDNNGKGVCACQIYGEKHPEHEHEIYYVQGRATDKHIYYCICGVKLTEPHCNFSYEQSSSTAHNAICECGFSNEQSHNLVYQDYHTSVCEDCGYVNTTSHVYGGFVYSSTQHWKECACGAQKQVGTHSYTYENFNAAKHKCICACGYEKLSAHKNVVLNSQYTQCTICKALFDSNGDHNFINKKKDDIEALLE